MSILLPSILVLKFCEKAMDADYLMKRFVVDAYHDLALYQRFVLARKLLDALRQCRKKTIASTPTLLCITSIPQDAVHPLFLVLSCIIVARQYVLAAVEIVDLIC